MKNYSEKCHNRLTLSGAQKQPCSLPLGHPGKCKPYPICPICHKRKCKKELIHILQINNIPDNLDTPNWDSTMSSWMEFIPEEVQQVWKFLSRDAKIAFYYMAVDAENRAWDF